MNIIDFEYDGMLLSDYGFCVAYISSSPSDGEINLGNNFTINGVKSMYSDEYYSTGYQYDDIMTLPAFDIMKEPICGREKDYEVISEYELTNLVKWLCRKEYKKLKVIYKDYEFINTYYNGYFNVTPIFIGSSIVGLTLNFKTNAPYAFMEPEIVEHDFRNDNTLYVNSLSEEFGNHYFDNVVITVHEDCNLRIDAVKDEFNPVIINNCSAGEVITMTGKTRIIKSSFEHPSLPNDFNFNFLRLVNEFNDNENVFVCDNACEIELTYSPIKKIGGVIC